MPICLGVSRHKFRNSFPSGLQCNVLMRAAVNQIRRPSLKVKAEILKHVETLAGQIQETLRKCRGSFSNSVSGHHFTTEPEALTFSRRPVLT